MPSASTAGVNLAAATSQSSAYAVHHHAASMAMMAMMAPMAPMVETSATGNKIEMVDPADSRYVPRVLAATPAQRLRSRRLLRGVNRFCGSHTLAGLKAGWRPGSAHDSHPTHYFNPERGASGINPAKPRAALVYDGKVGGVMFTGQPLPYLGVIPRAHRHTHGSMGMGTDSTVEMVHVYCTRDLTLKSLREAFTPNRQLGVLADTIHLRLRIRPAVMDLSPRRLRQVRNLVRSFVGAPSSRTAVAGTAAGGPDPRLQAMRTEIRQGLMKLDEAQLRRVWRLMKS
jgi:hypothetical protein